MTERLEQIYTKIQRLIDSNSQLKKNNEELNTRINSLLAEQSNLKKDLEIAIEEKVNTENKLKFNTLAPENLTKQEIKSKIDQYISEIERCIEQIEKL